MCDQPIYLENWRESSRAKWIQERILSLPIHEKLSCADLEFVSEALIEAINTC